MTMTIRVTWTSSRCRILPGGAVKILVAIADVDAVVRRLAIDDHAAEHDVGLYCREISPCSEKLSTDLTSLNLDSTVSRLS